MKSESEGEIVEKYIKNLVGQISRQEEGDYIKYLENLENPNLKFNGFMNKIKNLKYEEINPRDLEKNFSIQLSSLKSRTIILCDTWIERQRIFNLLSGFKSIGKDFQYKLAPYIYLNPEFKEYQTMTRNSVFIKDKNIEKINSTLIL